ESEQTDVELHEYNEEWAQKSKANLKELRLTRNDKDVSYALKALEKAAKGSENVMPYLVKCCHAYATVGEMAGVFRETFGEWNEPEFY
ncbi:methylmalonyl-CoA mutase family protein, partial [Desulfobacula sp.]|uniref:methylmalonyl-CoA mutase family protein n=1 Tax=Desulfobacula sp. TaxID=2593537 RepID=UPI0027148497